MRRLLRSFSRIALQFSIGIFALLISAFLFAPSAQAALTLTSGTNATTTPNVATAITGFQIVGPSASTTPVQLRVTSGSLSMSMTTGLTFSGPTTGSSINFSGTVTNINNALATLRYTRSSTGTDTLEVSLVNQGEVFFGANGHLYQYIAGSYTWSQAKTAAEGRMAYNSHGYLATITSSTENDFVYTRISGDGWLGATDEALEGTWLWATGPEATQAFYTGVGGAGGAPVSGRYNSWASGEPNDYGTGEDCGYMYASQSGEWNDFPCSVSQGYVVEFGAPSDMPTIVATDITIVTADVPAITSLSPANGATLVSPSSNLVINFSKSVTPSSGAILIKKASDNSTVESINVASGQVTGSGTTSITINPSTILDDTTAYYIIVPSTAFVDASLNPFEGVSASTTWTFTTADVNPPLITSISTSTAATSTLSVTWDTSELASTKFAYGLTDALGLTTVETDTSTQVLSHSVSLNNLLPCTSYQFAVVSRDASLNSATSSLSGFTTAGCSGNETPLATTSTVITSASGGSSQIESNDQMLTVTTPSNFTTTSTSVAIQIKAIPNESVLAELGRPTLVRTEVGPIVFDVKAIINNTTVLDSFDHEVTLTYTYNDTDVVGLNESSLWLYHYHNDEWQALNACTINTDTNTVSCTTPNFSIFGLFGNPPPVPVTRSGGMPWSHVDPTLLPAVPPFIINNNALDAPTTTDRTLHLTFNADPITVNGYAASLRPDFASASIFPLSNTTFTLPDAPGTYRIYLKYYSTTGLPSVTFSRLVRLVSATHIPTLPSLPEHSATSTLVKVDLFTRPLTLGTASEDVRRLQRFLNERGLTVKATGAGSPGNESTLYGSFTANAVRRFQETYASTILTPLGLRRGTGLLGTSTIAFINQLLNTRSR